MMIPFDGLVERFKIKASGVLHIGSNTGQEALDYKKHGINKVVWIEAIPEVFDRLTKYLDSVDCHGPDVFCINACIGDVDGKEVDFGISNNEAQSSSYLPLGHHMVIHPTVHYERHVKMKTTRIDTIFSNNPLIKELDLLNIDIQGSELQALKSMGILLTHFKYAIIEINMQETYIGGALVEEIDEYMNLFDFERSETGKWVADSWTDGFYIKRNLL